jgi:GntR family transcriptional regulator, rspAB operon transcriptional repressor
VRETLECRAVADAAQAPQPAAVAQLREMLDPQDAAIQARDFTGFFALDEAMHRALMGMAGRPFVWQVITGAKAQVDRVTLPVAVREWPDMIMDQHRGIVEHVAARDSAGAVHLRTAFAAIGRIAAAHPEFFEGSGTHPEQAPASDGLE